jgi:uncharacterized protein YoxC
MLPVIVVAVVAVGLIIVLLLVGLRASKLTRDLEAAERTIEMAKRQNAALQGDGNTLAARLTALDQENKQNLAWLRVLSLKLTDGVPH